ncbi:hypothetical protein C5L34_002419 [Lentilactobacillus hilgardii]|nr:hypothetical protein C5L34_001425 [Lentilactobacillus hilgardii]TDG79982.1 hypothetical protein C5L34_001065 [Lentilactobacillus hilgardii]TDG82325.1 hypothetical protein C5L34_002420 [Lentilactobacillus hilgardii]TDG83823.1 hypothetical protein C5L34_000168 [Lentilactobacillus hilgardii]TDG85223.1 hypothetical protein C5L34_000284 [Lentilactobacillus hilgardii]
MQLERHAQATSQSKSQMLFGGLTSGDEDRNLSREATHVTLPRKASSESSTTRTANRHR